MEAEERQRESAAKQLFACNCATIARLEKEIASVIATEVTPRRRQLERLTQQNRLLTGTVGAHSDSKQSWRETVYEWARSQTDTFTSTDLGRAYPALSPSQRSNTLRKLEHAGLLVVVGSRGEGSTSGKIYRLAISQALPYTETRAEEAESGNTVA